MFTKIVTVGTTAADLKTLMTTAGKTFPNDNDKCTGVVLQIAPDATGSVDVLSTGETAGITLDNSGGPTSIAIDEYRVRNIYLKGSAAGVSVKTLVEDFGG